MGGSTVSDITGTAGAFIDAGVGATTGGLVQTDFENGKIGKINTDIGDAGKNWVESVSGGKVAKSLMPEMPKLPTAPSAAEQARRAGEIAKEKVKSETGGDRGLASTITGGSTSEDNSILRKKKLLGE